MAPVGLQCAGRSALLRARTKPLKAWRRSPWPANYFVEARKVSQMFCSRQKKRLESKTFFLGGRKHTSS